MGPLPLLLEQLALHGPWLLFLLAILETCFVTGLVVLLAMTGLPGEADVVAGDGSEALRRGWAARWAETAPVEEPAEPPIEASRLDRSGDNR